MADAVDPKRRISPWIWGLVVLGFIGAAVLLFMTIGPLSRSSMRVRVLNGTAATLTGVGLSVTYSGSSAAPELYSLATLAPGEDLAFKPRTNDVYVTVTFVDGKGPRILQSGYIDLWTGESYVLEIQPDGTLKGSSGYPQR